MPPETSSAADPGRLARIRRRCAELLLAALLLALGACASTGGQATASTPPSITGGSRHGTVVRVVDGDTAIVRVGGKDERVRLLGVDAAESVTPNVPVGCFGPEASAHLKAILPAGAGVQVVGEGAERDGFGRLLAYLTVDGQAESANLQQVAGGFAQLFRKAPSGARRDQLVDAEATAKRSRLGRWAACP